MEQVFHEMGIGSVRMLHEFYQQRVRQYHRNQIQTCHHLVAEYEKIRSADSRLLEETKHVIKYDFLCISGDK